LAYFIGFVQIFPLGRDNSLTEMLNEFAIGFCNLRVSKNTPHVNPMLCLQVCVSRMSDVSVSNLMLLLTSLVSIITVRLFTS